MFDNLNTGAFWIIFTSYLSNTDRILLFFVSRIFRHYIGYQPIKDPRVKNQRNDDYYNHLGIYNTLLDDNFRQTKISTLSRFDKYNLYCYYKELYGDFDYDIDKIIFYQSFGCCMEMLEIYNKRYYSSSKFVRIDPIDLVPFVFCGNSPYVLKKKFFEIIETDDRKLNIIRNNLKIYIKYMSPEMIGTLFEMCIDYNVSLF